MDKAQLQAEHPGLYAVVFNEGKAEGKSEAEKAAAEATASEKDRIEAHLVMGETTGDMKLAVESIRKGDKMTQTLSAKYMAAGMNKRAVEAREDDDAAAAAATGGAATGKDGGKTKAELFAEAIERQTKGDAA